MIPQLFVEKIDLGDGRSITIETGRLAKQADGSVVVRIGKTVPKITVFPILTTTEPSACFAKRPVSIVMLLPSPKSIFSTNNCGIINLIL